VIENVTVIDQPHPDVDAPADAAAADPPVDAAEPAETEPPLRLVTIEAKANSIVSVRRWTGPTQA
jgi:hypothetical protein